jgi:hypothetical protein
MSERKILQFPGAFQKPNDSDKKENKEKDEGENLATTDEKTGRTESPEIPEDRKQEITDVLNAFHDRMAAVRAANPGTLWDGINAREMNTRVSEYTMHELVLWAWKATDKDILQKPLFFNAISMEILKRLLAGHKEAVEETPKEEKGGNHGGLKLVNPDPEEKQ